MRCRPVWLSPCVLAVPVAAAVAVLGVAGGACASFSAEETRGNSVLEGGTADGIGPPSDAAPAPDAAPDETSTHTNVKVLASGYADLTSVVATETYAYFVARTVGIVYQVRVDGTGGVQEFYRGSPLGSPSSAALYDFNVYVTDSGKARLAQKAEGGGTATTVTTEKQLNPAAIAVGNSLKGVRVVVLAMSGSTGTV